jgi:prepilin signal peptidase PulO-like enzyme (type II secretory pathway)
MRIAIIKITFDHLSKGGGGELALQSFTLDHPLFHSMIWLWLAACAIQDWRYREVSNWLTIPVLITALGIAIAAGGERVLFLIVAGLVYGIGAARDQVGGADFKIATALGALWPAGFVFGHIAVFIWGIVAKIKAQKVPFVVPLAIGAAVPLCQCKVEMSY